MPDPKKFSDKAEWSKAAEGIYRGTLKGVRAGAEEWPGCRIDEVTIEWSSRPKFLPDGTAYTDSDEPGIEPVKVTTKYAWQEPKPTLKEP